MTTSSFVPCALGEVGGQNRGGVWGGSGLLDCGALPSIKPPAADSKQPAAGSDSSPPRQSTAALPHLVREPLGPRLDRALVRDVDARDHEAVRADLGLQVE